MAWLLATTKPYQQEEAERNAAAAGFKPFLPRFARTRIVRGRRVTTTHPVFDRYVFAPLCGRWPRLLSTRGFTDVVRNGEEPVPVPDAAIEELMRRIDENGLFIMPRHPSGRFKKGTVVTPTEGPLRYFTGLYEGASGKDREEALFECLGAQRRVVFAAGILRAA